MGAAVRTYPLVIYANIPNSCGASLVGGPWEVISAKSRGQWRPVYEIAYAHYVQRQGKKMPWTQLQIQQNPIETIDGTNNMGDDVSYGTLRFSLLEGDAWAYPNASSGR